MPNWNKTLTLMFLTSAAMSHPGAARAGSDRAECLAKAREAQATKVQRSVEELAMSVGAASPSPEEIEPCRDVSVDLREAAIGFKCRTSKDAIFERVARDGFGEAWKGPDGLVWSDYQGNSSQYGATKACEKLGGALPSRADFARGESRGIREVLPGWKSRYFWSSSVYSSNAVEPGWFRRSAPREERFDLAYTFRGDASLVTYTYRSDDSAFRCVGRRRELE